MIEHLHDRITEIENARKALHDLAHPDPVSLLLTYGHHERIRESAGRLAELAARMAGGEYRPPYNGWLNRETWAVGLHLGNTQDIYNDCREIVAAEILAADRAAADAVPDDGRRRLAMSHAADRLQEYTTQLLAAAVDIREQPPGRAVRGDARLMASDLLNVGRVDWRAIAEGMAEE